MRNHDDSSNLPVPFTPPPGNQLSTPLQARFMPEPQEEASREGVVAYWRMVMRHKWIVILVAFLGATAGILITLPQTPIYQSTTLVEVQGLNENFLNMQNLNPTSVTGGWGYEIMTQVRVLQSRSLMEKVTERLLNDKKT